MWQPAQTRCFNPRPPFGTGASYRRPGFTNSDDKFQSTPALWDGRFKIFFVFDSHRLWFQSTPALWDGRFWAVISYKIFIILFQSTPALWDGRFRRRRSRWHR
ncbi:protein of unknown function [Trichlorobacter ammonificans]|uniref:Uncharacterized protein n=1 Tax=Trichlorobacter ammonificans TaxID=2916410 RepID=A0ABN8HL86_9BACT|nr:protein of unknown function [Trichlorobacter ammonificans]